MTSAVGPGPDRAELTVTATTPTARWRGARAVVGRFLVSRTLLLGYVALVTLALGLDPNGRRVDPVAWALDRFVWWDSFHFLRIARQGYVPACCDQAFFPGYPLAVSGAGRLTGDLVLAGLLVSLVAGAAACLLLYRLAAPTAADHPIGVRAAGYLAVAPAGVFLTAVYSEALFLALALGSWLAATRQRWWWAGLLAAAATAVRINGLFLTAALVLMYVIQLRRGGRCWPRADVLGLLAPAGALAAVIVGLHAATGSWTAWQDAETTGWDRRSAWPWQGLIGGWNEIWHAHHPVARASRVADLAVVVAGLVLLAVLLRLRHWPEGLYLALNLAVLVCSTTLVSAPRYALAWFPGYLLVARLSVRPGWSWLHPAVLVSCVALFGLAAWSFTSRHWVA